MRVCVQALMHKRIKPPIVPTIVSASDLSFFEHNADVMESRVVPYVPVSGDTWDAEF